MPKITGVCVGESLVGEGNEVAHVDLLIGPRGSAVETAYCIGLTNNKDGFTTLLALVAPNLMCKPPTILYNKVTIKDARQAVQMFGPAQHAVAMAVAKFGGGRRNSRQRSRRPVHHSRRVHPLGSQGRQEDPGLQLSRHQGSHRPRREGRAEVFRGHCEEELGAPSVCRELKRRTPRSGGGRQTPGPVQRLLQRLGF